jgi:hypothetical protein
MSNRGGFSRSIKIAPDDMLEAMMEKEFDLHLPGVDNPAQTT